MERGSRHQSGEKFGGAPDDLPSDHLPSFGEIAAFYYKEISSKSSSEALESIEARLKEKWAIVNAGIPLISDKSLQVKIKRFVDKFKAFDGRRGLTKAQRDNLTQCRSLFFDIAACKCDLPELDCSARYFLTAF